MGWSLIFIIPEVLVFREDVAAVGVACVIVAAE